MAGSLPDSIWYLGEEHEGTRFRFTGRTCKSGETYILIWTDHAKAQAFVDKNAVQDPSLHQAASDMVFAALVTCGVDWVVIDAEEEHDGLLSDPTTNKLKCGRTGDVWPYVRHLALSLDMTEDQIEAMDIFAASRAEKHPLEVIRELASSLAERTSMLKQHTQSLQELRSVSREYAKTIGRDPDQVFRTFYLCGVPDECSKCGERTWAVVSLSPSGVSLTWKCKYCGKQAITKGKKDTKNMENGTRPVIPKDVQREVWQRDQGRCVECGGRENLEFDHIIPISKGGANTARNIQLLCQDCNRRKSDKAPGT